MTVSSDDFLQQADEAFGNDDFEQAAALFEKALEVDPENPGAILSLSAAYFALEDFDSSLKTAEKGLVLFPDESRFAFNAGLASNRLGEIHDAIHYYSLAVETDPHYALAYYARGNCYFDWKEYKKAESDYLDAYENGGEFDNLLFFIGNCLDIRGKYGEALDFYGKSIEKGETSDTRGRRGICHYLLEGADSPDAFDLLTEYWAENQGNREAGVYLAAILRDRERYEELGGHLEALGMVE